MMENNSWRSGITDVAQGAIRIRGYEVTDLMAQADFTEVTFLLVRARLPRTGEKRLLNAMLVASADHGPKSPSVAAARMVASGNRASFEAAVAAGVLAIGDAHGGAGEACMQMIAAGLEMMRGQSLSIEETAAREVARMIEEKRRIPGLGHRLHTVDPRSELIFKMAREEAVSGAGVQYMEALAQEAARQIRHLPVNLDGAMAAILHDLGFPPVWAKAIFILGRVAGITAHVQEETTREKPMRFGSNVTYDGPAPRHIEE